MKKAFSTKWKSSSQPRKQRKYLANAPLHTLRKMMSVNLSKELRTKYSTRNAPIKKGDTVKILVGKFKGKKEKVIEIKTKLGKIYLENIQAKKQDGSKVHVPFRHSNLQIVELNTEDKKRFKRAKIEKKLEEHKVAPKTPEKKQ